jgi:hexosaminidase
MVKLRKFGPAILFSVIITVAVAISACAEQGQKLPEPFKVIPQPREVELTSGAGLSFGTLKAVELKGDSKLPITGPILSCLNQTDKDGKGVLTLKLDNSSSMPKSNEGYVLVISDGKAEISSGGQAGLFYGCQTLEQLMEDARDTGATIPACKITDYPALSYRAVHFDIKHHLDNIRYYYDCIDQLAKYKINAAIFEFEDKLGYRRQPRVAAPQAFSIEEMATLTKYAQQRHIEISPLVQGLGHVTFILKHPQYAYLRENPDSAWTFCPLHEGVYQVTFDLYRDAIEATPGSRYLHVGGDETGNVGLCPRCKPTAEKEGVLGLNLYWLNRVCEFATANGRIPIFWDDMPLNHAGVYRSTRSDDPELAAKEWEKGTAILDKMIERFPKDCVYMRWNYTMARQPGNIRALDWYRDRGLKVMVATAAEQMEALLPKETEVDRIKSFVTLAAERGIDGMLCTAWDDSSPHMETYWRGFIASAEYSWNAAGRSLDEFETAYLQREFGPECTNATDLYSELSAGVDFWTWGLFEKGSERVHHPEVLLDVPDLGSPGKWSQKHNERLALAEKELERYNKLRSQLAELSKKAQRNRYQLEMLSAINDLQITAAQLLLALQKCDVPDVQQQKAGMKDVRTVLEEFNGVWENLMKVYGKTRFIVYPESYVQGPYLGIWPDIPYMASIRTDESWLIRAEERYHKLVRDWLRANGG